MRERFFVKKAREKGLFQMIFPVEYDFEAMLAEQAEKTVECVESFIRWLRTGPVEDPKELRAMAATVDEMRYKMEEKLMDSFSTPFDRQDIYTLSRQMDYIVNYSYETAREMFAFGVEPDPSIMQMAQKLLRGTRCVAAGVSAIRLDQRSVEIRIRSARQALHEIDDIYIDSMARLFQTSDPMSAMKKREVYHHMRDAGRALRATVDTLHHAVMGII